MNVSKKNEGMNVLRNEMKLTKEKEPKSSRSWITRYSVLELVVEMIRANSWYFIPFATVQSNGCYINQAFDIHRSCHGLCHPEPISDRNRVDT